MLCQDVTARECIQQAQCLHQIVPSGELRLGSRLSAKIHGPTEKSRASSRIGYQFQSGEGLVNKKRKAKAEITRD